jgi:magnesium-transporting ATPase (P-type)
MSDDKIKDEDRITRRDLLQANATLITGVLIFLSIFMGLRSDKISNEIASIDLDKLGMIANLISSYFFFLLSLVFFLSSMVYVLLERPVKTGKLDDLGKAKACICVGIICIIGSIIYLVNTMIGIIATIIGIIIISIIIPITRSIIRRSHS